MSRSLKPTRPGFTLSLVLLTVLLAVPGCNDPSDNSSSAQGGQTARFERELKEADHSFAREVAAALPADRGRVWADWFSPEGRQFIPGQVVQGPRSIADLMGPLFANPGYSLTWEPDVVSAATAGDMGWTSGRYESRSTGPDGETVRHGRYLTIWQRQADGSWKVTLDTGVPDSEE